MHPPAPSTPAPQSRPSDESRPRSARPEPLPVAAWLWAAPRDSRRDDDDFVLA